MMMIIIINVIIIGIISIICNDCISLWISVKLYLLPCFHFMCDTMNYYYNGARTTPGIPGKLLDLIH